MKELFGSQTKKAHLVKTFVIIDTLYIIMYNGVFPYLES